MNAVAVVLVALVALLHASFLVLEMFLWTTPTGRRVFGLEPAFAEQVALETRTRALNPKWYEGNFSHLQAQDMVFSGDLSRGQVLVDVTGVGVEQTSDSPIAQLNFWSIRTTICPEAYIHVIVQPGETKTWTIRYRFFAK